MTVLKYMLFEMNYIHLSCKTFVSYLSHWFGHFPSSVLRLYFFIFTYTQLLEVELLTYGLVSGETLVNSIETGGWNTGWT